VLDGSISEDQYRALAAQHLVAAGFFGALNALKRLSSPSEDPFRLPDLIPWAHYANEVEPEQPKPTKKKNARNPARGS
jgi:hypothetical protein